MFKISVLNCLNPESNQLDIVENQALFQVLCPLNSCFSATPNGDATGAQPTKIYMYGRGVTTNGNLGSRTATTAACANDRSVALPALTCSSDIAFISYSTDALIDAPANYGFPSSIPVVSETETVIATNWADLWDGAIAQSVEIAGVDTIISTYWTGTAVNGSVSTNCEDWTSNLNIHNGTTGFRTGSDNTWIANNTTDLCDTTTRTYLCICW